MDEAFGSYHPVINFIFFVGAIMFGMFFVHPIFLSLSTILSITYYLLLNNGKGSRFLIGMVGAFTAVSLFNPIINTNGNTILFTYLNGRAFTLESFCYGAATGSMFLSVILWFSCYNTIMTSDKFIFLFGKFIPSAALVLSMVLRLVPKFTDKILVITGARECIGKFPINGSKAEKLQNSMTVLSVLTSLELEEAIVTADSMKNRGYGAGNRTSFAIYHLKLRDRLALTIMLFCIVAIVFAMLHGAMNISYIPAISIPKINVYTAIGILGYAVFLAIPTFIHIWEAALWHILRLKI